MNNIAALVTVSGALAGVAQADTIVYKMTATIDLLVGGDAGQLDGASFLLTTMYDDSGVYIDRFGFPAVDGTGSVTIDGAGDGSNNTTVPFVENTGWYPTFAGNFSSPGGQFLTFYNGRGELFQFAGTTIPTPGAADAVIGGTIELDDFAPGGAYLNADGGIALTEPNSGDRFTLTNVEITADYIPAPGALALLAIAGLAANRRR